jgi:glycosyltransferase involved in cell wall biosynthesis
VPGRFHTGGAHCVVAVNSLWQFSRSAMPLSQPPFSISDRGPLAPQKSEAPPVSGLAGKRVAMVSFSPYPADPRPRRAAEALLKEGVAVDIICLAEEKAPAHERAGALDVVRLPIRHRRGGKLSYAYQYSTFIIASAGIMALRCLKRRYHLVYIHNMPDMLVFSALAPKLLGAKVILDQHDPMPELMTTIFGLDPNSASVRLIKALEKLSIAFADMVITVNIACKRIFASRSCRPEKIGVVMNAPDDDIFGFQAARVPSNNRTAPTRRFVIMYHGSIVERNGLDLAVDAFARVQQKIPNAELRIYGRRNDFLDRVLEDATNMGVGDRVRYLGPKRLEELVPEIEACDVGIVPNQRNAFTDINTPTRIFEYLSRGKAVIAPRTPGVQDYFEPDSLQFFEPGNAEDLASQIERVYSDPGRAIATAARGQHVYLTHTWRSERHKLISLVTAVLLGEPTDCARSAAL